MGAALLFAVMAVTVPQPLAAREAAVCPNAGLKTMPVTFSTATGRHRYTLEIAGSAEQQECGLMFRKSMPRAVGMWFPFDPPRPATFWMENTPLPLDLIFVGADDRVISVSQGVPFSREMIDSGGVAASVIELNAGEAARIGLKPGDRITR